LILGDFGIFLGVKESRKTDREIKERGKVWETKNKSPKYT